MLPCSKSQELSFLIVKKNETHHVYTLNLQNISNWQPKINLIDSQYSKNVTGFEHQIFKLDSN